jgi:hypothetical protein
MFLPTVSGVASVHAVNVELEVIASGGHYMFALRRKVLTYGGWRGDGLAWHLLKKPSTSILVNVSNDGRISDSLSFLSGAATPGWSWQHHQLERRLRAQCHFLVVQHTRHHVLLRLKATWLLQLVKLCRYAVSVLFDRPNTRRP